VLAPFQALAGLEMTLELGVERIRDYNLAQKALLASLLPVEGAGEDFGAFVTVRHRRARALVAALEQQDIKADARGEYLRLCPDILNPRAELERAAGALLKAIAD
jgi:kynureninase